MRTPAHSIVALAVAVAVSISVSAVLVAGCSDDASTDDAPDARGADATGADASSGDADAANPDPTCPSALPTDGTSCSRCATVDRTGPCSPCDYPDPQPSIYTTFSVCCAGKWSTQRGESNVPASQPVCP